MFFGLQKFYALPFACADVRVFVLGMKPSTVTLWLYMFIAYPRNIAKWG